MRNSQKNSTNLFMAKTHFTLSFHQYGAILCAALFQWDTTRKGRLERGENSMLSLSVSHSPIVFT